VPGGIGCPCASTQLIESVLQPFGEEGDVGTALSIGDDVEIELPP